MSWAVTPTTPGRKCGPTWGTTATAPPVIHRGGWFALLEKATQFSGDGTLTATVASHIGTQAPLSGDGTLSVELVIRNYRAALLSGTGLSAATMFETRSCPANFSGGSDYSASINDGLTAIIEGGGYPDGLSAEVAVLL
jgi:hypothetical protein